MPARVGNPTGGFGRRVEEPQLIAIAADTDLLAIGLKVDFPDLSRVIEHAVECAGFQIPIDEILILAARGERLAIR